MAVNVMNAKDTISAKLANAYLTTYNSDGSTKDRLLLFQAKNLEATVEKNKSDVAILGRTGMGHKSTGWNGTGSLTIYKNTSVFDKMCGEYKKTGEDMYFDLQVTNEDPTSAAGRSVTILKGCNIDGAVIASFDADGEWLEQDIDFTFEDYELKETFNQLTGMQG